MALPSLHSFITPSNTYPDKVRAHFQYQLPEGTGYDQVMEYLHDEGFMQVSRRNLMKNTIEGSQSGFLFDVTVSYARPVSRLHIYVDLNVLRHIHAEVGAPNDETGLNRSTNWLPEDWVPEDNHELLTIAEDLIWEAEREVTELVEYLVRSLGHVAIGIYQGAWISSLEVAVDFCATDTLAALNDLAPNFRQHIRQIHLTGYRPTINTYESLDDDSRMLHGYRQREERYKAYVKTNRRVRLECECRLEAFHRLGTNRMISDEGNSFRQVFNEVSTHCAGFFNLLLETADPVPHENRTAMDFLLVVGQACRNTSRATRFVQTLAHNGRVTSDFEYKYLRPFMDHGLIRRAARGIYVPAEEWQHAISQLREQLGNLLGEVM